MGGQRIAKDLELSTAAIVSISRSVSRTLIDEISSFSIVLSFEATFLFSFL